MAFGDAYRRKVCYYFDREIGSCHFGEDHPMKPHRLLITHELIVKYGLYQKMNIYKPFKASADEMKKFHNPDYVFFLEMVNSNNINSDIKGLMSRFGIGTKEKDCPFFDGLFNFAQISVGASLAASAHINDGTANIAINWAGGLHHAKKSVASGFCYVNDIVLCILDLLKFHRRVLYIDIDIHHADAVEEAFYTTNRVMTVSFHRFGKKFFPGTGSGNEIGYGPGEGYSVNVPLKAGITDEDYEAVFITVMTRVMQTYEPEVIVMQCGSDSITGDRLGDFNLTLNAHGRCVRFMRNYNLPMILLGGGGYTVENVSRCWCFDTAVALNETIGNSLPDNDYATYFEPNFELHLKPDPDMVNRNDKRYLNKTIMNVFQNLKDIEPVPSVQFQPTLPSFMVAGPHYPTITVEDSPSPERHRYSNDDYELIVISDDDD